MGKCFVWINCNAASCRNVTLVNWLYLLSLFGTIYMYKVYRVVSTKRQLLRMSEIFLVWMEIPFKS